MGAFLVPGTIPGLEDEQHRFPALLKLAAWPECPPFLQTLRSVLHISEISLRHAFNKSEGLKIFYAEGENEAVSFIFYLFNSGKTHVI